MAAAAACKSKSVDPPPPAPVSTPVDAAAPRTTPPSPWIEDDFSAAVARARAEKKLVFVDAWATWCHTCKAMRAFVLTDDVVRESSLRDRLVFVSIDTERPENAAACAKLPLTVLPTFFVVDPRDERIVARWEGAASPQQLRAFFDDATAASAADGGALDGWRAALRDGDRAEAAGKHAEAAALYEQALALAPADWTRRPDVLVLRMGALARAHDWTACLDLARREHTHTGRSSSATDFATVAVECEERAKTRDPVLEAALSSELGALAKDTGAPLSADDRSDALRMVWDLRERGGDAAGAKAAANDRLTMLEAAAATVSDPEIASTFDGARLETLLYLDRPADAVILFEQREKELPLDYNSSYRLGKAYFESERFADALAATDRALGHAYGARKGQILGFRADVLVRLGRTKEAKAAVAEQLALSAALPEGQRHSALEKAVSDRLAKM
ncbi:hypothetical protein BH09MYX1_BH09MYX1_44440 [soil metagenome]